MRAEIFVAAVVAAASLMGCRGQTSKETPLFGIRNMYDQPKYDIQEESAFFPDHRTMRPLVEGVVAREADTDPRIAAGRLEDESGYVLEIPKEIIARFGGTQAMVERGRARYGVYCTPCHDATGNGEGLAKKRAVASGAAAFVPPTFHQDRIRHMPDGQLFATITNGKSNMPPYGMQIPVNDRWAIVSYVRVLQVAGPKLAGAPPAPPASEVPMNSAAPAASGSAAPSAGSAQPGSSAAPAASSAQPAGSARQPSQPSQPEKKP